METHVCPATRDNLDAAAALLRAGGLCAFPTETVYGLGALASDERAVRRIFEVKGRPADNPLIIHVAGTAQARTIWSCIPSEAFTLMEAFWPGPLTLVLPRRAHISDLVTAGLGTVAVRCPAHEVARGLIDRSGPLAAPSANASGRPSPTTARHVYDDLAGRIPMILDAGPCAVGVESTVLDLTGAPTLLRPGGVSRGAIEGVLGCEVALSPGVLAPLEEGPARSPGMKHRHYAPRAAVSVVGGNPFAETACRAYDDAVARGARPVILCYDGETAGIGERARMAYGSSPRDAAARLFALLREADRQGYDRIIAQGMPERGTGGPEDGEVLAVLNRLLRAADFFVIGAGESTREGNA